MRISTKGRYALRLMLDIAMNDAEGKPVRVKDIAKRQEVSGKYLEQIVSVLTKAGYLRSIRGPQGGYLLTKHPNEYTVGMILQYGAGSLSGRRKRSLRKNGRMYNDSSLEKAERGNQRGARPYDIS